MTRSRRKIRSWWTACSPYLDGFEGFPEIDLAASRSHDDADGSTYFDLHALEVLTLRHPSVYEAPICDALVAGPMTFADLAWKVARVRLDDAIGSAFEFALWAMVEAGAVKVSPEPPARFAPWFSVVRPNFARALDRTLERRYA